MTNEHRWVWEIIVPVEMNGKEINVDYHREWDTKVRKISGGLTISKVAKGQWISPSNALFVERVIPVKIACTKEQIRQIADITLEHYKQEEVMYYKISNEVHFLKGPKP